MDTDTTIDALKKEVIDFRDRRNWKQFHDVKNLVTGLSIESAELQELFLWKNPSEAQSLLSDSAFRERLGEELADVLVYLLYISEASGIDLSMALGDKLKKNAMKYPVEKSYNNSRKYRDL